MKILLCLLAHGRAGPLPAHTTDARFAQTGRFGRRWLLSLVMAIPCLGAAGLRAGEATEAVLAADRARATAMVGADVAALDGLLADDLRYTHSDGRVETKAAHLESYHRGLRYEYFRTSALHAHAVATDVVVLTGVIDQRKGRSGKMADLRLLFQAVWRQEGTAWRLTSLQTARTDAPAK